MKVILLLKKARQKKSKLQEALAILILIRNSDVALFDFALAAKALFFAI